VTLEQGLLFALLVIAADFGLDVVLGAFLAGVVLRHWAPGDVAALEAKLDAVGYGFSSRCSLCLPA
jgi:Kef-type K+ transport system membrane component KefB